MLSEEESSSTLKTNTTSVSKEDWSASFFGLATGGQGKPEVSGNSSDKTSKSHAKIDISVNCTLVTVDRSSWFQPQFFGMSDSFMRNNNRLRWTDTWPAAWNGDPANAVQNTVINPTHLVKLSLLAFYSTGYIISKDVVIRVSNFKCETVAEKSYLDKITPTSGEFLFFSTTKTTQTTEESQGASTNIASDGMIIRIPVAQMLVYIQQMTFYYATTEYNKAEALCSDLHLPIDTWKASPALDALRGLEPLPDFKGPTAPYPTKKERTKRQFAIQSNPP